MLKKLRITVEGKTYEVTVEVLEEDNSGPEPALLPSSAPASASTVGATSVRQTLTPQISSPAQTPVTGPGSVVSPLAGTVVEVHATVGQAVKQGDRLITLEAMKMNTAVVAPSDGRVSEISAEPGVTVQEGQVLMSLS